MDDSSTALAVVHGSNPEGEDADDDSSTEGPADPAADADDEAAAAADASAFRLSHSRLRQCGRAAGAQPSAAERCAQLHHDCPALVFVPWSTLKELSYFPRLSEGYCVPAAQVDLAKSWYVVAPRDGSTGSHLTASALAECAALVRALQRRARAVGDDERTYSVWISCCCLDSIESVFQGDAKAEATASSARRRRSAADAYYWAPIFVCEAVLVLEPEAGGQAALLEQAWPRCELHTAKTVRERAGIATGAYEAPVTVVTVGQCAVERVAVSKYLGGTAFGGGQGPAMNTAGDAAAQARRVGLIATKSRAAAEFYGAPWGFEG